MKYTLKQIEDIMDKCHECPNCKRQATKCVHPIEVLESLKKINH